VVVDGTLSSGVSTGSPDSSESVPERLLATPRGSGDSCVAEVVVEGL